MFVPLRYNLRSLGQRATRTAATVLGVAASVAVYVVMTSVSATMQDTFGLTGDDDQAVVMQAGTMALEYSTLARSGASYVRTLPQVATSAQGEPLVSEELYLSGTATAGDHKRDVIMRGVTPMAFNVYRNLAVRGERPGTGRRVVVGRALASSLGLDVGGTVTVESQPWTVVGILSAGGSVYEQEVWMDLDELGGTTRRTDLSNLLVRVKDPSQLLPLVETINNNRQEPLVAVTARAAYARVGGMSLWMASLGKLIALIIALGAVFGGMNTMYAAVASRSREIGILRALGFGRGAVLLSVVTESCLLGLAGGALGCVLGWALGHLPIQMAFLSTSDAPVRPAALLSGIVLSLVVGVLGGLLPSLAAARAKLVDALR